MKKCFIYGYTGTNAVVDCTNVTSEIFIDNITNTINKTVSIDLSTLDELQIVNILNQVTQVRDISLIRVDDYDMFNANKYNNVELVQVKSFNRGSYSSIIIQFALNKEVGK